MIRILFLAANPIDQAHLRIRQELGELRRVLDSAEQGKRFTLIPEFAVAASQLQELLFRHQPQIIHFSGHGQENGALLFEGAEGVSHPVSTQALHDLFAQFNEIVRCVILNACYSQTQASAIATVIDSVVGMNDAVTDEAALNFAPAFFRALANGKTLATAFNLGCNQLDLQNLDEAHKPRLFAGRIDASKVRALDWDDGSLTSATTTAESTTQINTGSGTAIQGNATAGRDVIGRDKIEHHYHFYSPSVEPSEEESVGTSSDEQIWGELKKLVIELYPRGPEEQQIWKRAGGDLSMLNLNSSGKSVWISAIDLLRKGGGGRSINIISLINAITDDFPNNPGPLRLKERLMR